MTKSIDAVQQQFNTIRAAGANPAMLDRVSVLYYGTPTPLNQVARVSSSGAQQLVVDPFEKGMLKDIEKSILEADLNISPVNDGSVVRISIPPLTEERRKDLVKQVKTLCEEGKVAIRNVRRDFVEKVKAAEKDKGISKDDSKDFQDDLQKLTDDFVKKFDNLLKAKEKDLMKI
ncbi:ribosome recycling factor [archaeon]|nr:MAG: ribosome recycling factor [archaeon]